MAKLIRKRDGAGLMTGQTACIDPNVENPSFDGADWDMPAPTVGFMFYIVNLRRWWATTPVTEILQTPDDKIKKDDPDYVFTTKNSTYEYYSI